MSDCDFLDEVDGDQGNFLQLELGKYVTALVDAEEEVRVAEEILKQKQSVYRKLSEEVLPDIMGQAGIDKLSTAQGLLTLKEDLKARIPADPLNRQAAFRWLREHGAAPLVKSEVVIPETDEQKISTDLLDKLRELGLLFSTDETVNTNSLCAYFRDLLGMKKGSVVQMEATEVPPEFGLFKYRKVTLKSN